ncbi:MAG: phage tail sheath subtilisin-like domain-containing protein [Nitrosomonas sp.]|nr:phage tail sheath subtilisin-like domain-containing protein [Nitrosomonas sp.]
MPSYLHPGVYIEEIPSGSKPIEGVSTSVTAFVGAANRGPVGEPVLIGKFDDYINEFGQIDSESDAMGLAVMAFYLNGGKAAYICRLAKSGHKTASVDIDGQRVDETAVIPIMTVSATSAGTWANSLFVKIANSDVTARTFDLEIGTQATDGSFQAEESLVGLSMDPDSENYVELRVPRESTLVAISVANSIPDDSGPDNTVSDGVSLSTDVSGVADAPVIGNYTSFYSDTLRKFRDVSIIVLPNKDSTDTTFVDATVEFCSSNKRCMVIVDPAQNTELDSTTTGLPTSSYSALYYPWVLMANPLYNEDTNPLANKTVAIPPSAIAAGMWAKIDGKRGVWKAPAGVETRVSGVSELEFNVEDLEQDQLNPMGVNCIRKLPGYGAVVWGSRTLGTRADPEWRYVPVRRTAIFIEQSIFNGIQWAVFEPNDHPLWGSLRANIGSFMDGLFRSGAFQGATAKEAYFVRCGLGDTMTQADIDRGQVIVIVGFAALKPAEFVIVRIQQKVGEK